jgi:hypothetical protein
MTAADALCRDCVARLDDALRLPPLQLGQEVDVVEREVARLRDRLIDQLRRRPAGEAARRGSPGDPEDAMETRRRAALDKVNAALSLIVGVEYPVEGIRRKALEQARDTLRQVLEDEAIR